MGLHGAPDAILHLQWEVTPGHPGESYLLYHGAIASPNFTVK